MNYYIVRVKTCFHAVLHADYSPEAASADVSDQHPPKQAFLGTTGWQL